MPSCRQLYLFVMFAAVHNIDITIICRYLVQLHDSLMQPLTENKSPHSQWHKTPDLSFRTSFLSIDLLDHDGFRAVGMHFQWSNGLLHCSILPLL
jgi:hypothetical protein